MCFHMVFLIEVCCFIRSVIVCPMYVACTLLQGAIYIYIYNYIKQIETNSKDKKNGFMNAVSKVHSLHVLSAHITRPERTSHVLSAHITRGPKMRLTFTVFLLRFTCCKCTCYGAGVRFGLTYPLFSALPVPRYERGTALLYHKGQRKRWRSGARKCALTTLNVRLIWERIIGLFIEL